MPTFTRWHTVPITALPVRADGAGRVRIHYDSVPRDILPNGLPRPQRVRMEAAVLIGDGFHLAARVVSDPEAGTCLQVAAEAWDAARNEAVPLALSPHVQSNVYRLLACRFLKRQARVYGRGEGRN